MIQIGKMTDAEAANRLGAFCGVRDLTELTPAALYGHTGSQQADVMVLFGGSVLCGGDVLAGAMRSGIAGKYMIVGGAGHTTPALRKMMKAELPEIGTEDLPEAELFNTYLRTRYGLTADLLETASTNCGNNITFMLRLLEEHGVSFQSMILVQDATMQRRMAAGLRLLRPELTVVNYAAYQAELVESNGSLRYKDEIRGMWSTERYIELLLGEIQRLRDDENGYGPRGKGYIAHEDIPDDVEAAFTLLKKAYAVRNANPAFASDNSRHFL